jgi:hypothetical protein
VMSYRISPERKYGPIVVYFKKAMATYRLCPPHSGDKIE